MFHSVFPLQHLPQAIVNETISLLLCRDPYSHFPSEALSRLCWQRNVCVARMVNLSPQPVFRCRYPEIKDLHVASHQHAWATWMKPATLCCPLTVCLPHWQRWWLPASGASPAAVGWLCHNPPAWGCGEFSKTGRCRFHLFFFLMRKE